MYLKIITPENKVFDGAVTKATIPTEWGSITILPNHTPIVSVIKPWILHIWTNDIPSNNEFQYILDKNCIKLSTSKGLLFVDGTTITVLVSEATITPTKSYNELEELKLTIEANLKNLRSQWENIEKIDERLITLKKIEADIELAKLQK